MFQTKVFPHHIYTETYFLLQLLKIYLHSFHDCKKIAKLQAIPFDTGYIVFPCLLQGKEDSSGSACHP